MRGIPARMNQLEQKLQQRNQRRVEHARTARPTASYSRRGEYG